MTWKFKLEPTPEQITEIDRILEVCCNVWNFALRERKDWLNSRKSPVNACSIVAEYILPADAPFPNYHAQAKRLTAGNTSMLIRTISLATPLSLYCRYISSPPHGGWEFLV